MGGWLFDEAPGGDSFGGHRDDGVASCIESDCHEHGNLVAIGDVGPRFTERSVAQIQKGRRDRQVLQRDPRAIEHGDLILGDATSSYSGQDVTDGRY